MLDKSLQEIAEFFGVERPSLSRIFSEFVKEGLINKIDNKNFTVFFMFNLIEFI